jgi:hypothetical protein
MCAEGGNLQLKWEVQDKRKLEGEEEVSSFRVMVGQTSVGTGCVK